MNKTSTALVGALLFAVCASAPVAAEGEQPATPPVGPTNEIAVVESTDAVPPGQTETTEETGPESIEGAESEKQNEKENENESENKSEQGQEAQAAANENPWRSVVAGLRPGYWEASVLPVQGMAMYYNPGVFSQVLDFRYEHEHISQCDECIGYVALLRAGDIDRRVWLQREGHIAEGPFWVVDVAAQRDIPNLLSRDWVVDIDHSTAMRWRMAGPIPITVYAADSPEAQEFAAAYFSSEMIPLAERHIIPPAAHSYRLPDDEMAGGVNRAGSVAQVVAVVAAEQGLVFDNNWID